MFIALTLMTSLSWASPMAIYGEDNRHEVYEEKNPLIRNAALSTAALISNDKLKLKDGLISISGKTLGQMFSLCEDERFRFQPFAANCSGTLVAQDIIMTAGHCYDFGKSACEDYSWVFDYRVSKDKQQAVNVTQDSVYKCSQVLHLENDMSTGRDFALIQLDRQVLGRSPVKLQSTSVKKNDSLVLIGHPSGLPTKIADNGFVLEVNENNYRTNLDAFSINSGSGVFNPKTGEAVGVLSSGRMDYESQGGCSRPKTYKMEEGNESVFQLKEIIKLLN